MRERCILTIVNYLTTTFGAIHLKHLNFQTRGLIICRTQPRKGPYRRLLSMPSQTSVALLVKQTERLSSSSVRSKSHPDVVISGNCRYMSRMHTDLGGRNATANNILRTILLHLKSSIECRKRNSCSQQVAVVLLRRLWSNQFPNNNDERLGYSDWGMFSELWNNIKSAHRLAVKDHKQNVYFSKPWRRSLQSADLEFCHYKLCKSSQTRKKVRSAQKNWNNFCSTIRR